MKALLVFATLFLGATAQARPAKCLILIDGVTYMNSPCDFQPYGDGTGSFQINARGNAYFASMDVYKDGTAFAYWNGTEAASHGQEPLGEMYRNGACRYNDRAIICAW